MSIVLAYILFVSCTELAWSQETLIVRWNNQILVNDSGYPLALIYLDEVDVRTSDGDPGLDGDGVMICRYNMSDPNAGWRKPNGDGITLSHNNDNFRQFRRTGSPTRVQLARTRSLSQDDSNSGLWTCNAGGLQRHVPLYSRGSGIVTINSLTLGMSPSFSSASPRFTLIASTSGGPPTNFSWRNDAGTISNGGSFSISIEVNPNNDAIGRMNCHYRSTLEVTAVAPGNYTYVAHNRAMFNGARMSSVVEGGDPSNLRGVQTGMNTIELTWDPPPGPPSRGYRVVNSENNISTNVMPNRLTINNLPPGSHRFHVTSLSQHFPEGMAGPLTISAKSVFIPNITLSQLTATSVRVSWSSPPKFSFTVVRYSVSIRRLTSCSSIAVQSGPRNVANNMTELFEGLGEHVNYRADVTVIYQSPSSFTVSPVTAGIGFTTSAISPSEVPRSVVHITTSRTMNVSWDAIDCGNQNGPNFHYDVDFQRMDGGAVPVGMVGNEIFTVEGLQPFTNYTFRVRGVNDAGNGDYTSLKVIQTNKEVPGHVTDLQVQLHTLSSVLVTWSPPQEPNGIIIKYELTYLINETISMSVTTNRLSFLIESIVNTKIEVRVRAYTIVGPGPIVTANITLSTPIVMNVRVESLTDASVEVFWDRITDIPGITEYIVYYAPVSSSRKRQDNEQSVTVPSTESSVEIGGLESTVEYQYQVTAVAMFGGRRLEGDRSPVSSSSRHQIMEPGDGGGERLDDQCNICQDDVSVSVSISVAVTFLLTIILNTTLLLGGYYFLHAHCKKGSKRTTSDTSGMAMKENAAYGPVTSSQQPHDYILCSSRCQN